MKENRSLIVIGSGPAAWTAAIYAARAELKPLVLAGEQSGGQLMLTTKVENYPGFADGVMGQDLMAAMRQQAEKLGVEIIDKNATALKKDGDDFSISVISSASSSFFPLPSSFVTAPAVIIATGASAITLNLPGEDRLMGRGVGTCAVCDAPLYKGKDTVFIIGGGDSAMEEAMEISKLASKVIILVRKESLRATPILRKRIEATQNIEIWYKSQALELLGDKKLEKVKINKDGNIAEFSADGLFYAIGHKPATEWLEGSGVELDENGYIITPFSSITSTVARQIVFEGIGRPSMQNDNKPQNDRIGWPLSEDSGKLFMSNKARRATRENVFAEPLYSTSTSTPGIFAAGDCVDFRYRQAIVAAGQGCMAALDAQRWLESRE